MPAWSWAALALLALAAALLVLPVRIEVQVKYDAPTVRLQVLCFSFRLWPAGGKGKGQQEKDGPAEQPPEQGAVQSASEQTDNTPQEGPAGREEPRRKKRRGVKLSDLTRIVTTAGGLMRLVFRVIRIREVKLVLPVHSEDAAQTAIQYGQVQAALGGVFGTLQNFLDIRLKQVDIIPDFAGTFKYRRFFYCKIMATPFIIMVAAAYAFFRLRAGRGI